MRRLAGSVVPQRTGAEPADVEREDLFVVGHGCGFGQQLVGHGHAVGDARHVVHVAVAVGRERGRQHQHVLAVLRARRVVQRQGASRLHDGVVEHDVVSTLDGSQEVPVDRVDARAGRRVAARRVNGEARPIPPNTTGPYQSGVRPTQPSPAVASGTDRGARRPHAVGATLIGHPHTLPHRGSRPRCAFAVSTLDRMVAVEVFVDPSCPWMWITGRWLKEVAPQRDLDDHVAVVLPRDPRRHGVAPTVPEELRAAALAGHAISHRMLRIFEAARLDAGEDAVDTLYTEWGRHFFRRDAIRGDALLSTCVTECGLDERLLDAADDEKWDVAIGESMEVAYEFGGPKTQTPTIVVRTDPPHGFKGPVMAPAPTGDAALRMWDAIEVLSQEPGFFEITRPRRNPPRVEHT